MEKKNAKNQDQHDDNNSPSLLHRLADVTGLSQLSERGREMGETYVTTLRNSNAQAVDFGRQAMSQGATQLEQGQKMMQDSMNYGVKLWTSWSQIALDNIETLTQRRAD